jgi:hypothetical protein
MILNFYSGNTLAKIVLLTGFIFLGFIILMIIQTFIKKQIISESKFPICHDMVDEYKLCARCVGFYVGFALFTVLLAMKTTIYMDFLRTVGVFPYFVVMLLILLSVPLHGALRRLSIIKSNAFMLHVIGFAFSVSIFLVGNFIIYLLYGSS